MMHEASSLVLSTCRRVFAAGQLAYSEADLAPASLLRVLRPQECGDEALQIPRPDQEHLGCYLPAVHLDCCPVRQIVYEIVTEPQYKRCRWPHLQNAAEVSMVLASDLQVLCTNRLKATFNYE